MAVTISGTGLDASTLTSGSITQDKIATGAITDTKMATGAAVSNIGYTPVNSSFLVGQVGFFAMATAPDGWLKADGAAVSRTTYANLFAAIGTTYGIGNGTSTFNLPDLRGEFIRGWDNGRGIDAGRLIGSGQGDAIRNITGEYIQYPFGLTPDSTKGAFASTTQDTNWAQQQGGTQQGRGTVRFDASKVVPTANENRPRNVALLACIKY